MAEQLKLEQFLDELIDRKIAAALEQQKQRQERIQVFKLKEAAAQLRVKESWLASKVREGKVPHRRVGRNVMFSLADINEILKRRGGE